MSVSVCLFLSLCVCVCVFACLYASISPELQFYLYPCYLWPWLGPSLAALRYAMYFRVCGWRHMFAHNGQGYATRNGRIGLYIG